MAKKPASRSARPRAAKDRAAKDRTKGFFVAFDYTRDALRDIDAFFRKTGKAIIALTDREILDEELAKKLA